MAPTSNTVYRERLPIDLTIGEEWSLTKWEKYRRNGRIIEEIEEVDEMA